MAASEGQATNSRFSNRSTRYLRSLDFGWIRTRFMGGGARKSNFLLFMLPVVASFGVGATHMISQSFMVYLKYQAMVDAYYYQEIAKQEQLAAIQEDSQP